MVAAVAAKIGMKCRLVQESWVPHEDAVYDRVGNILLSRIMGADVAAGRRRLRHRHPRELGAGDRGREGQGRQALSRFRPAPRCTNTAVSAMSASPRRCARRRRSSASPSTTSWSAPSPARPMPACWSASPRTAAQRKVIGIDASCTPAQTKAQVLDDRPQHRRAGRARQGDRRRRRRPHRGLCLSGLRRAVAGDEGSDPPLRAPRRHDHRPGLRGQIDAGHDRPREEGLFPRRARRCSTPISAARRPSTATPTPSATDDAPFSALNSMV